MARRNSTDVKRAVDELVRLARKQGFVTTDDVALALPMDEGGPDDVAVDELYTLLAQAGVEPREAGIEDVANVTLTLDDLKPPRGPRPVLDPAADSDDTISIYLRDIGRIPLLTAEEEISLAQDYEAGREAEMALADPDLLADLDWAREGALREAVRRGRRARDRLIKSNFRLVVHMAKRYAHYNVALQDLIQEGNVGLIRAVEKFDYRRGFKFSTYATWWIKQAITRALADQARTIRVPVHITEQIAKVSMATRKLEQHLGRDPTGAELATELGLSERRINEIREISLAQRTVSLDAKVGDDSDSDLMDFIPDNDSPELSEQAGRELLRDEIDEALATLSEREKDVIELRYGLVDGTPHTLEEVGERFGVTRERIRQIETKAIRRLRHPARSRRLRDYLR